MDGSRLEADDIPYIENCSVFLEAVGITYSQC